MSEEENDGTWSGLKKTIIGTLATVVTGGGVWLSTTLFGGGEEAAPVQAAPAPVVVNVENNNSQQQNNSGGNTTVIKETVREVPAQQAAPTSAVPVEEKKETPAERIARLKAKKAAQEGEK